MKIQNKKKTFRILLVYFVGNRKKYIFIIFTLYKTTENIPLDIAIKIFHCFSSFKIVCNNPQIINSATFICAFLLVWSVATLFIGVILDWNPCGLVAFILKLHWPTIRKCNQVNYALQIAKTVNNLHNNTIYNNMYTKE